MLEAAKTGPLLSRQELDVVDEADEAAHARAAELAEHLVLAREERLDTGWDVVKTMTAAGAAALASRQRPKRRRGSAASSTQPHDAVPGWPERSCVPRGWIQSADPASSIQDPAKLAGRGNGSIAP